MIFFGALCLCTLPDIYSAHFTKRFLVVLSYLMKERFSPKLSFFARGLIGVFLCVGMLFPSVLFADTMPLSGGSVTYTSSERTDLVRPTVVRILQHVEGSAEIPSFIIDGKGMIAIDPKKASTVVPVDNNILGTGFFVSSSGIILTNAHSVSDTTIKLSIVFGFIEKSLKDATGKSDVTDVMKNLFTEQSTDFVLKSTTFSLTKDIIVLNPQNTANTETSTNKKDVFSLGVPAIVLHANDLFYKQGDDVAVIKINLNGYPSNVFSKVQSSLAVGDRVFAAEPGSVDELQNIEDLGGAAIYNVALQEVVVTRLSLSTSTPVAYTDNSAQRQSLGGPVVNASGEIIGMTTYGADAGVSKGSVPVIIIPRLVLEAALKGYDDSVNDEKTFDTSMRKAFASLHNGACNDAKTQFALATAGNPFVAASQYDSYVSSCNEAQTLKATSTQSSSGGGIILAVKNFFGGHSLSDWLVVVGAGIFLIGVLVAFRLILRMLRKRSSRVSAVQNEAVRSEDIKNARRTPIGEQFPLSKKDAPVSEKSISQKELDAAIQKPVSPERESEESVFHTTPAHFPGRPDGASDEPDILGSTPQKDVAFGSISPDDQKRLAALWPAKYGASKESPGGESTVVSEVVSVKEEKFPKDEGQTKESEPALGAAIEYVFSTRKLGFSDDEIREELLRIGWEEKDVAKVFRLTAV